MRRVSGNALLVGAIPFVVAVLQAPAFANDEVAELRKTVEAQAAVIKALEERLGNVESATRELESTTKKEISQTRQEITRLQDITIKDPNDFRVFWKDGLNFATEDERFKLKIGGRIQTDFAFFDHSDDYDIIGEFYPQYGVNDEQDGVEFRRARLYMSGTIYDNFSFKAQYDFAANSPGDDAGKFKDVWMAVDNIPYLGQFKVGHFKEPFSLEELTSCKYITFMERALPNVFAPSRNLGVQLRNVVLDDRLTWAIGAFKTVDDWPSDNDSDEDQGWSITSRLTGLPWYRDDGRKLLHLGMGYSRRNPDGNIRYRERPEAHLANRYVNTNQFHADTVDLFNLEAALVYGPFSLQGEYMHAQVETTLDGDKDFSGYYAQASYFLTGEHRPYKKSDAVFSRVKPKNNFSIWGDEKGWGAWEVALRYSSLDLNDGQVIRGGEEDNLGVALNWYLNPNMRVMLNYIHANIDHDLYDKDVDILQTRFQIEF